LQFLYQNIMQQEVLQHRAAVVEQWRRSGKTQVEFAREHQLPLYRFRYWIRCEREKEHGKEHDKERKNKRKGFVRINTEAAVWQHSEVIIRYPNGVELYLSAQTPISVLQILIKS